MKKEGKVKITSKGVEKFKASNGKWYDIIDADMSHIEDAVSWWNREGRKYGAKSNEFIKWMLDPKNYYLEHKSINRSLEGKLMETYLPPLK